MNIRSTLSAALPLALLTACTGHSGGGHSGAAPSALQYSENFSVYMVDEAHAALTASVQGSVNTWTITPALPAGLALDPQTGAISGTPQASALRRTYTVRATNAAGFAEATIELAVEKPERYAYVTSHDDITISILGLDATNGSVTRRGFVVGQPWEGHPECFQPNPARPFGYSTTGEGILTTWAIDAASGWLTELDATAVDFGTHTVTVAPDGAFVFVANQDGNEVTVFRADLPNGLLVQIAPGFATPPQPSAIAIDASGTRLAVACQGDASSGVGSSVALFTVNPVTGMLSEFGPGILLNGTKPADCAFSPRQDVLYVCLPQAARLLALSVDPVTGDMASLGSAGSGAGCNAVAIDPLGRHAWAVNQTAGTMKSFAIQANGSLNGLATLAMGTEPRALAIDPLGRFLFSTDAQTQELALFDLDAQSGGATHRTGLLTRGKPVHVSFGRGERALTQTTFELLSAAFDSDELLAHSVNATNGALGAGISVATNPGPLGLVVDARQRFAFTCNAQDNSIASYAIDGATGALTPVLPVLHTQGFPICAAADASGRFLYAAMREVTDPTDGWVNTYAVDGATGALTLIGSAASGFEPNWLGVDPTGQFLYVANTGNGVASSATIAVLRLSAATGLPTSGALTLPTAGIWSLGFHPSGRYLYAALHNTNSTVPFGINKTDGTLSALDSGVTGSAEPMSVVVTPDGRFAYVATRNGSGPGTIGLYSIDAESGKLVPPASPFLDGIAPLDLAIDASGRFLYSANSGTDSISAYAIQSNDGALIPLAPAASGLAPSSIALLQRWQ